MKSSVWSILFVAVIASGVTSPLPRVQAGPPRLQRQRRAEDSRRELERVLLGYPKILIPDFADREALNKALRGEEEVTGLKLIPDFADREALNKALRGEEEVTGPKAIEKLTAPPRIMVPSVTVPEAIKNPTAPRIEPPLLKLADESGSSPAASTAGSKPIVPELPRLDLRVEVVGNGFAVHVTQRERIHGEELARALSEGNDPSAVLGNDPSVAVTIQLPSGDYDVWLRKSDNAVRLHPVDNAGKKTFQAILSDGPRPPDPFSNVEYLRLDLSLSLDRRVYIDATARGPPDDGTAFTIVHDTLHIPAVASADGNFVYIKAEALRSIGRTPEDVVRLSRALDSERVRVLSTKPESDRTYQVDSILNGKPPLIAHLEAGRQREAARLMAANPDASRVTLEADRAERVLIVDRCLKLDRFAEALDELKAAVSVHGAHPALLLRRGLAEIGRGRPERALEVLNQIGHEQDPQQLTTEINRRLRGKPSSQEREYLLHAARMNAGRTLSAHKEGAEFAAVLDESGKMLVEATLPEPEPANTKVVGAENLTDNAIIYMHDSAGNHNLDRNPAAYKSIHQPIEGGTAELLELYGPAGAENLTDNAIFYMGDSAGYHNLDRNPAAYKSIHQAIEGGTAELLELYGPALRVKPDRIRFGENSSGGSGGAGSKGGSSGGGAKSESDGGAKPDGGSRPGATYYLWSDVHMPTPTVICFVLPSDNEEFEYAEVDDIAKCGSREETRRKVLLLRRKAKPIHQKAYK